MQRSLRSILIASAMLGVPQLASASLLVGFYDFTSTGATESADYAATGYSGIVTKTNLTGDYPLGSHSRSVGGSVDGTYGNVNFGGLNPPTTANGYVVSSETWLYNNDSKVTEFVDHSFATFRFGQSASGSTTLGSLLFDAATAVPGSTLDVYYTSSGGGPSGMITVPGLPTVGDPTDTNYHSYALNLLGLNLSLTEGGYIDFKFDGNTTARMDNIGLTSYITPIPEPGSLVALGCLVGSGAFLRTRRRSAAPQLG